MEECEIGIIGGGAAGLMAGISAAENGGRDIVIFEGTPRCGTKILMSGGSRCNVTNEKVTASDFYGGNKNIIRNILKAFTEKDAVRFFQRLGVELKLEANGKYFPSDDKASTILNALLKRCRELSISIKTGARITSVKKEDSYFTLRSENECFRCRKLIITTGGKSYPSTGSDGTGYKLAEELGHSLVEPLPALTPIVLNEPQLSELSGITFPASLMLFQNNKKILERTGSTLITHFGLSGPAPLNVSREIARLNDTELKISFLPGKSSDQVAEELYTIKQQNPARNVISYFGELIPAAVNRYLFNRLNLFPDQKFSSLKKEQIKELCISYTELRLKCAGVRGFKQAEVTSGGVPLDEIKYQTMESRKTPDLYLAGELLDADGLIGGYNFQWSWSTGYIAGKAAAG